MFETSHLLGFLVRPERGEVVLQFIVLGLIVAAAGLLFGSLLALTAGSFSAQLTRSSAFSRWQERLTGAVLLGLGVRLAVAKQA